MVKTIALPAGSEEVLIRNIPRLLTDATYPQMPEDYKVIGCLQKREVPDVTPDAEWENISWETLTEGDWVILNRIWEDSGLPPYRNKMCMSEWLPYAKAIEAQKLDWEIIPGWTLLAFLRDNLESEHRRRLIDDITNGEVTACNQITRIPLTNPEKLNAYNEAIMSVSDFTSYAKKFDIQVQVGEKEAGHVTANNEAESDAEAKTKGGRPKMSGKKANAVRMIIELFEKTAENEFTSNDLPGSAADLLDACKRIEKAVTNKASLFGDITADTFKTWLKAAGYGFSPGRTRDAEEKYWTNKCPQIAGIITPEVFTDVYSKATP